MPIVFYNTILTLVFFMLSLYAKSYEETKIIETKLKLISENERNYYINILDNLNVGFFISKNQRINLYNKFITNIMEDYNKSKKSFYESSSVPEEFGLEKDDRFSSIAPKSKTIEHNEVFSFLRFLYEEPSEEEKEKEEKDNNDIADQGNSIKI